jgi:membrane fusion protein (multidrug efflux system)
MKNLNKTKILIALAVAGLLIFEWRPWHHLEKVEVPVATPVPIAAPAPTASPVPVAAPAPQVEAKQDIRAQLSAVTFTTITAEMSARIQRLPYKEGQAFTKGQPLVTFDCSTQQAQLQRMKALLGMAERNYQTNKRLLELNSVGRIETENSYSEFLKAKAEHQEVLSLISRCTIAAPYSGLVFEQKARPQQYVQAGQSLMEILDNSALEVEFIAPSKWSHWLVKGYQFQVQVDETEKSYPAKITRINSKIDAVSQTIKIVAVIDGKFKELSPGMSGVLMISPPDGDKQ